MKYSINKDTLIYQDGIESIEHGDGPEEENIKCIVIPGSVERIDDGVFMLMHSLERVVFAEGLKEIGEKTFAYCEHLKEVVFPESLEMIEEKAFFECTSLERIVLPKKQEVNIWNEAFADCIKLSDVELGDNITLRVKVFENTAFLKALREKDPLVIILDTLIDGKEYEGDLIIPDKVKNVSCGAFYGNTKLTSVVCPDSVDISYSAFEGCTSLKKVVLPANMKDLPESLFKDCISLEEIVFPKSEDITIYGHAFHKTPYLRKLQTGDNPVILNGWLVDGSCCQGKIHLSGIKGISSYAFMNNYRIIHWMECFFGLFGSKER